MLHLLREERVEQAIISYPNAAQIPTRNIAKLRECGEDTLRNLLSDCIQH